MLGDDSGVNGLAYSRHASGRRTAISRSRASSSPSATRRTPQLFDGQLEMKGGYIIVTSGTGGMRDGDQRARRLRRRRRGRPRLSPGHHVGRHRLHGGARRRQVPRAARRRQRLNDARGNGCASTAASFTASRTCPPLDWDALDASAHPVPAPRVPVDARGNGLRRRELRLGARSISSGDDAAAQLAAAIPLYLKAHSWGEFVFDWSWAQAYQRAGRDYYPKLLSAIPFTPVTGPALAGAP